MSSARKLTPVFAAIALLSAATAHAVGLGHLTVNSALNAPLDAEIRLFDIQADESKSLSVAVAPAELFENMGLERSPALDQLRFRLQRNDGGSYAIRVTSKRPITEPFLNILLEVKWASGRIVREFTLLLDPPVLLDQKPGPTATPEASEPKRTASAPVAETRPAPPIVVPVRDAVSESRGELFYRVTQRGDALWNIAEEMRPRDVTREQMMLALLRENPQAFYGDNVSMLKEGRVLRIKDRQALTAYTQEQAIAEIAAQNQEWLAYRRTRDGVTSDPNADGVADAAGATTVAGNKGARLRLVSPAADANSAFAGGSGTSARDELKQVRNELALASEALETTREEADSARQRVATLEKQVAALQRLIKLQDQELSRLQGRGEPIDETEAPPVQMTLPSADDSVVPPDEQQAPPRPTSTWQNPLLIAGALGGAGVLAGLFAWLASRRRRELNVINEPLVYATEPPFADEAASAPIGNPSQGIEASDGASAATVAGRSPSGFQTEFGEIDPISEADVYIAYGRYQKAKDVIRTAIKLDPDRHELKLKLLEVFYLEQEKENFMQQAEELYAALGGDDNPLWGQAAVMGRELLPENSLFAAEDGGEFGAEIPTDVISDVAQLTQSSDAASGIVADVDEPVQAPSSGDSPTFIDDATSTTDTQGFSDMPETRASEMQDTVLKGASDDEPSNIAPSEEANPLSEDRYGEWAWLEKEPLADDGAIAESGTASSDDDEDRWLAEVEQEALSDLVLEDDAPEAETDSANGDDANMSLTAIDDTGAMLPKTRFTEAPDSVPLLEDSDFQHLRASADSAETEERALSEPVSQATAEWAMSEPPDSAPLFDDSEIQHLLVSTGGAPQDAPSSQTALNDTASVATPGSDATENAPPFEDDELERMLTGEEDSGLGDERSSQVMDTTLGDAPTADAPLIDLWDEASAFEDSELQRMLAGDDHDNMDETPSAQTKPSMTTDAMQSDTSLSRSLDDAPTLEESELRHALAADGVSVEDSSITEASEVPSEISASELVRELEKHVDESTSDIAQDARFLGDVGSELKSELMASAEDADDHGADEMNHAPAVESKHHDTVVPEESSFFLFTDEIGTKLDLARAYIEMGDREGAREILSEVLSEGNEPQRQEAQELMELAT